MPCALTHRKTRLVLLTKVAALCILLPAALTGVSTSLWGQDTTFRDSLNQWLASQHVRLTTVRPDKEIVTPGSQFVLQQDGLVLTNTKRSYAPSNSYKDGVIKPELAEIVERRVASGEAKVFNTGDKLWVISTSISPKDNTVVFGLLSDQYDGNRFYGMLKFPTPKGAQPDAQVIVAMLSKTFSGAPSDAVAQAVDPPQARPSPTKPAAPRVARSGPAPTGGVFAGVKFQTIKSPEVAASLQFDVPTLWLDLNLLQNNLALLDDPEIMKYFILVNNCAVSLSTKTIADSAQESKIERVLANELDYPAVAAYYKEHAAELLTDLPTAVGLNTGRSQLREYDTTRHAFPFGTRIGGRTGTGTLRPVVVAPYDVMGASVEVEAGYPCGLVGLYRGNLSRSKKLPGNYIMDIGQGHTFTEVPLDLAAAHTYLDTGRSDREVTVDVKFDISDPAPRIEKCDPSMGEVICGVFKAQLKKVTVLASPTTRPALGPPTPGTPLAVLYP